MTAESGLSKSGVMVLIRILDGMGVAVKCVDLPYGKSGSISTATLRQGVYILQVNDGRVVNNQRLVIAR